MRRRRGHGARGGKQRGHGARGGGGVSPLPYDAIGALSPDFFVQFKYPVYDGQQVLFRDELCTSPVTDAGNHTIGGVKDPFTGEIILTQANAAAKPLWMGSTVGAKFDGIDDYLIGDNPLSPSSRTVVVGAVSAKLHTGALAATRIDSSKGFETRTEINGDIRSFQSTNISGYNMPSYSAGTPFIVSTRFDQTNGHWGRVAGNTAVTEPSTLITNPSPSITIGRLEYGVGVRDPFEGTITETPVWTRSLTIPEIEIVEQCLEAQ